MHILVAFGALCIGVGLPGYVIFCHLKELRQPDVQWILCKIVFLVPILSILHFCGGMGIVAREHESFWRMLREMYSCYALYLYITPLFYHYIGGNAVAMVHMDAVELTDFLHRRGRPLFSALRLGITVCCAIKVGLPVIESLFVLKAATTVYDYTYGILLVSMVYCAYCINLFYQCLQSRLISLGEVRMKTWLIIALVCYMPLLEATIRVAEDAPMRFSDDVCLVHSAIFAIGIGVKFSYVPFKGPRPGDAKPLLEQELSTEANVLTLEELDQEGAESDEEFGFLYKA